jgi:ATP-dependent helicase STH1/SNF2
VIANPRLTQEEQLLVVQRLHEVLRPFVLRRIKKDVQDQLPEKREHVLRVPLSYWQHQLYKTLLRKGIITTNDINGKPQQQATGGLSNTIMQLRKVCNHPYLFLKEYVLDDFIVRLSGKFLLLDRMLFKLKAAGHRVLIFSQMVETLKLLEEFLNMRGEYSLSVCLSVSHSHSQTFSLSDLR